MMYGCIHLIIWVHCACYKQLYFTVARTALCNVLNTGTDGDAVDIKYTVLRVNTNLQSIRIHNLPEYRNKGTPVRVSARSGCIPQQVRMDINIHTQTRPRDGTQKVE